MMSRIGLLVTLSWLGIGGAGVLGLATAQEAPTAQGVRAVAREESPAANRAESARGSLMPGDVHLQQSRVFVFVGKKGFGHEHAVVGRLSGGNLRLTATTEPGWLKFDMRSFIADTHEARQAVGLPGETDADTQRKVNENMLGSDVLNVAEFPTAALKLRTVQRGAPPRDGTAGDSWLLTGEFTLHGVTREVQLPVLVREVDGWTQLRGRFTIKQTDYGIRPFSKAFGAIGVADELVIFGDLWVVP